MSRKSAGGSKSRFAAAAMLALALMFAEAFPQGPISAQASTVSAPSAVERVAENIPRGQALYEMRCQLCHERSVHLRESRKATDYAGIMAQVMRWDTVLGGGWTREEINAVTEWLNERYYGYECPESICRRTTRLDVLPRDAAGDAG